MADNAPESGGWVTFRNAFTAGAAFFAKFMAPIAAIVASMAGLPPGVANILRAIPDLINAAELAIPEAGNGPAKKQMVLDSIRAFLAVADSRFTGQAKSNFDALKPVFNVVIDQGVAVINYYAKNIIGDDAVTPPLPGPFQQAPVDSP